MTEPAELVQAARAVVERPGTLPRTTWPRAAALLARQALETAVADRLAAVAPGLEACSRATQFIALRWYVAAPDLARHAHQTWAALSHACHHHAYDLPPTGGELRRLLEDVEHLVDRLAGQA